MNHQNVRKMTDKWFLHAHTVLMSRSCYIEVIVITNYRLVNGSHINLSHNYDWETPILQNMIQKKKKQTRTPHVSQSLLFIEIKAQFSEYSVILFMHTTALSCLVM